MLPIFIRNKQVATVIIADSSNRDMPSVRSPTGAGGTESGCYEKTFTYWTSSVAGPDGHCGLSGS